jgi:subtilisin family serine protease
MGPSPMHGTHVSGIIAAQRNNNIGIDGVADHVQLMMIRAVPDGDEYDKDIALAIRYAVDNGAKIINMSFGKGLSPEKKWVDEAVRYAELKDVLIIHAAGNDAQNTDSVENYPNANLRTLDRHATNIITVGASADPRINNGKIIADFSNYGAKTVDIFAPGVKIYSTIPGGNTYGFLQGTSMAAPVVTGIAALIRSHFPNLTAQQVKYAIEKSASVPMPDSFTITYPGKGVSTMMTNLETSGGIVNAYGAVLLATQLKPEIKEKKTITPHIKKYNAVPKNNLQKTNMRG